MVNEFGKYIRGEREANKITLRKFADQIGVTPTYVSKIERGEFKPPAEELIRKIARTLVLNEDKLLGLADKVSSDLPGIILRNPVDMPVFLRTASKLNAEELRTLTEEIKQKYLKGRNEDEN